MKKVMSLTLALLLLLTTFPVYAMAAETGPSDHDELVALACEVFPEYSSTIRGENLSRQSRSASLTSPTLVLSETRYYSDNMGITYAEYSDGTAYAASYYLSPFYSQQSVVSDGASTNVVTGTVSVVCNYNEDFFAELRNVKYAIVNAGYDYFISAGTAGSCYEIAEVPHPHIVVPTEGAHTRAEAHCNFNIYNADGTDTVLLELKMYLFNGVFSTTPDLLYST